MVFHEGKSLQDNNRYSSLIKLPQQPLGLAEYPQILLNITIVTGQELRVNIRRQLLRKIMLLQMMENRTGQAFLMSFRKEVFPVDTFYVCIKIPVAIIFVSFTKN